MLCVNRACVVVAACVPAVLAGAALGDDCPPPLNVSATETVDCIPVDVYWDIVSAFEYNIWRAPIDRPADAELIGTTNFPPFTDYSGPIGEQVLYWVSAVAECGESERAGPDFGYRAGGGAPPPAWISASDGEIGRAHV